MSRASRLGGALLAAALCLPLTMCGGAAQAPAASPAQGYPETEESAPKAGYPPPAQPGYAAPPAPPPGTPAATASGTTTGEMADAPTRRAAARAEMDRATHDLEAAASDCSAACRALASMQRAADHLCSLAGDPDDQKRCDDAQRRVIAARERIKSACGTCP